MIKFIDFITGLPENRTFKNIIVYAMILLYIHFMINLFLKEVHLPNWI